MKFLIDANVLSEPTKPEPAPPVVAWLRRHERELAVDPIILGEMRFGILLLARSARRTRRVQCLPWDREVGLRWAELLATLRAAGLAMPIKDSQIAPTTRPSP